MTNSLHLLHPSSQKWSDTFPFASLFSFWWDSVDFPPKSCDSSFGEWSAAAAFPKVFARFESRAAHFWGNSAYAGCFHPTYDAALTFKKLFSLLSTAWYKWQGLIDWCYCNIYVALMYRWFLLPYLTWWAGFSKTYLASTRTRLPRWTTVLRSATRSEMTLVRKHQCAGLCTGWFFLLDLPQKLMWGR